VLDRNSRLAWNLRICDLRKRKCTMTVRRFNPGEFFHLFAYLQIVIRLASLSAQGSLALIRTRFQASFA